MANNFPELTGGRDSAIAGVARAVLGVRVRALIER
jgi:hypothetical protein